MAAIYCSVERCYLSTCCIYSVKKHKHKQERSLNFFNRSANTEQFISFTLMQSVTHFCIRTLWMGRFPFVFLRNKFVPFVLHCSYLYLLYTIVLAWLPLLFDTWDTWHSFSLCHHSARQTLARIICRIFLRQLCKNWPWLTIAKDVCPILWKLWSLTIWLCNCCKTLSHNWKAL